MSLVRAVAVAILAAGASATAWSAEQRCILEGFGVLTLDPARWTFTTTSQGTSKIHTVSANDGTRRIIWVYRRSADTNFEQAVVDLEDLVRARGDLTIVDAPRLPMPDANGQRPTGLYLITGLLADYDALRIAKVAIDVDVRRYMTSTGWIRISTVSDPVSDPELQDFAKQIVDYGSGVGR